VQTEGFMEGRPETLFAGQKPPTLIARQQNSADVRLGVKWVSLARFRTDLSRVNTSLTGPQIVLNGAVAVKATPPGGRLQVEP
jgi:hypothetical protein